MSTSYNTDANLSEIIYEPVTPEYGWGKYGEFRVLIRRSDGYINATKLCALGGKELFKYMENKSSQRFIEEVAGYLRIRRDLIVFEVITGPNDFRGTYVHQDLVPHIASWVSPQFAIRVSKIVNNFVVREYRAEIARQKAELGEKDNTIDDITRKLNHIIHQNELLLQDNQGLLEKCDTINDNLDFTVEKLISTADTSVPNANDAQLTEQFVLYKRDPAASEYAYNYGVIRAQRRSVNRMLAVQRRRYPSLQVVYNIEEQPNSVNLYNRFKASYENASFANNSIRLLNGVTESEFINRIREIHEDRNEVVAEVNNKLEGVVEPVEPPVEKPVFTADTLRRETVKKLRDICRNNGYRGYSSLSRSALITHIVECQ